MGSAALRSTSQSPASFHLRLLGCRSTVMVFLNASKPESDQPGSAPGAVPGRSMLGCSKPGFPGQMLLLRV